jgi:hypothetical protein
MDMDEDEIDLGHGHYLGFVTWTPDRQLNPQYADLPDNDRIGAFIRHTNPHGEPHGGSIMFDCPQARRVFPKHPLWTVDWETLTINPSIQCSCGDHGHITNGRWVPS